MSDHSKIYLLIEFKTLNMSNSRVNLLYKLSFNIKYERLQWKFTLQIEFKH